MAVLTTTQLDELRQSFARDVTEVRWTKAQANDALQECEDYIENSRGARPAGAMRARINAAVAGFSFTDAELDVLIKVIHKFKGDQ